MKKFTTLVLMLLTITATAQYEYRYGHKDPANYIYVAGSFDPNMAFGIKDNKDTFAPDRGFDWDIELGVRDKHVGLYIFYGEFREFDYLNYGAGADYYIQWLRDETIDLYHPFNGKYLGQLTDGIDLSLGLYTSFILRQDGTDNYGSYWAKVSARGQVIIWNDNVGLLFLGKLQDRPELNKFKFEGSIGIIIKFDRG